MQLIAALPTFGTVQIDLRFCGHRLIVGQLRFGLIERRLIDVALDAEQRCSLLDCGAVLIIDGFQITLDARDQIRGSKRRSVASQVQI
jgi:hypothetical protein